MSEFLEFVLYELGNILTLLVLAGVVAAVGIGLAYLIFRKKHRGEKKYPWRKILLYLALVGYLFIVVCATILRKMPGFYKEYNLHLFRAWIEAWNNFSAKNWANVLLNVAMFVPLGALLPLLWKKCRKWYITIPLGFGTSLAIELVQLAVMRGIFDVDDLFANALGGVIGFFCIMAVLALGQEKGSRLRPFLGWSTLALIPILAIGSIFVCYSVKEYGNLADAPAYTNNTSGVSWTLDCSLPDTQDTAPVYRTQPRSKADCDAFAEDMAALTGAEVGMVSYYQEFAYYNLLPGGILKVYYYDDSYEFLAGSRWDETKWTQADRETVEKALSVYPAMIPEAAEFSYQGDGWHTFSADRLIDGALMLDGTLRARYADSGEVVNVENFLNAYAYYKDVEILSPEEAYRQLKAGRFNDGGYFESAKPASICVTECVFAYLVDTKGFYQPVYVFYLEAPDGSYGYHVKIPARK